MKTIDNLGRTVGELNHSRTADGTSITTNTMHDTYSGRTVSQNITVRQPDGKVKVTNLVNGKLLP